MIAFHSVHSWLIKQSTVYHHLNYFLSRTLWVFWTVMLWHGAMFFSPRNLTHLLLSGILFISLRLQSKSWKVAILCCLLATMPFAKGKSYSILLLAKENITVFSLYDIQYHFPILLADIFLVLGLYIGIRDRKSLLKHVQTLPKLPFLLLFAFISYIGISQSLTTLFPNVLLGSLLQLIKMSLYMLIPLLLLTRKSEFRSIVHTLAASAVFQSLIVYLQQIKGGSLGRDIESYLPLEGFDRGVFASEQSQLLRANGTFYEPSILGTFLFISFTILLRVLLNQKHTLTSLEKKLLCLSLFTVLIGIIFTGSRVLYVLLLLNITIQLIPLIKSIRTSIRRWLRKKAALLLVVFLNIGIILFPYINTRLSFISEAFSTYGTATYRIQLMRAAWDVSVFAPFGIGISLSPYYFATHLQDTTYIFDPAYPHNLEFHLLMETGFIGLALFLAFLYIILRSGLIHSSLRSPFWCAILAYLACAQFYPIFINQSEILTYLFLLIGIYSWEQHYEFSIK